MSYYDDRPRRQKSTTARRRDDYEDSAYDTRDGKGTSLVRRRDDSVSSVEEVTRDFPPGERGGGYYRETTVRKQGHRPVGRARSFNDDYYDDRYDDRSGYGRRRRDDDTYVSKRRSRGYNDGGRRSRHYDSYSDNSSRSRTPPRKERRKSTAEELLASVGLGGVAGAILGKGHDRSRSRDRARSRSRGGRRSASSPRGGRGHGREQVTQALKAALLAGVGEAVRARKEPGGWGGEKGKRVLTAAVSAGGVDTLISNNKDPHQHGTRDVIGSALAGLATNRIVNGPRSKSRGRNGSPGSTRGRSQSRGGLGDLVAGGALAATGKKIYDNIRSRSRGGSQNRGRSRSSSRDSYGSRSPGPRKRSNSVSAGLAKGLAAVGFKDAADKVDPGRRGSRKYDDDDDYYDDRSGRNGGHRDNRDVGYNPQPGMVGRARSVSMGPAPDAPYTPDYGPRHTGDPETDSDSDLGSSSGEERRLKQGKRKGYIAAGLATVATIHAGHNVYQSMEKREARRKAVREGDISKAQAQKEKNKNRLQDVASIGVAALGIKGAYSEWKEMSEHSKEMKEEMEKLERHKAKREARRRKLNMIEAQHYTDSGFASSMPNLAAPDRIYNIEAAQSAGPYSASPAPRYYDDNPYSAMGPPPHPQEYAPQQQYAPHPQEYAAQQQYVPHPQEYAAQQQYVPHPQEYPPPQQHAP